MKVSKQQLLQLTRTPPRVQHWPETKAKHHLSLSLKTRWLVVTLFLPSQAPNFLINIPEVFLHLPESQDSIFLNVFSPYQAAATTDNFVRIVSAGVRGFI